MVIREPNNISVQQIEIFTGLYWWSNTGTGCPERWWTFHARRLSSPS